MYIGILDILVFIVTTTQLLREVWRGMYSLYMSAFNTLVLIVSDRNLQRKIQIYTINLYIKVFKILSLNVTTLLRQKEIWRPTFNPNIRLLNRIVLFDYQATEKWHLKAHLQYVHETVMKMNNWSWGLNSTDTRQDYQVFRHNLGMTRIIK